MINECSEKRGAMQPRALTWTAPEALGWTPWPCFC
jgi:hypothetical protein